MLPENVDLEQVKDEVLHDLLAVCKAYEEWEAGVVFDADWSEDTPLITQELFDRLLEIQSKRNEAIQKAEHVICKSKHPGKDCNEYHIALRADIGVYGDWLLEKGRQLDKTDPQVREIMVAYSIYHISGAGIQNAKWLLDAIDTYCHSVGEPVPSERV